MDPGVLFGSADTIEQRVVETIEKGRGQRHIMNLGHGVMVGGLPDACNVTALLNLAALARGAQHAVAVMPEPQPMLTADCTCHQVGTPEESVAKFFQTARDYRF
jgi:Uroporphyrinogen decarboxylase (URO-D)